MLLQKTKDNVLREMQLARQPEDLAKALAIIDKKMIEINEKVRLSFIVDE